MLFNIHFIKKKERKKERKKEKVLATEKWKVCFFLEELRHLVYFINNN